MNNGCRLGLIVSQDTQLLFFCSFLLTLLYTLVLAVKGVLLYISTIATVVDAFAFRGAPFDSPIKLLFLPQSSRFRRFSALTARL
jgi:hypothetical protein